MMQVVSTKQCTKTPKPTERAHASKKETQPERLNSSTALPILVALRAGDNAAEQRLRSGFEWMVHEYKDRNGERQEEWISYLYEALVTSVRRLMSNDEIDAQKFIESEMDRSVREFYRDESRHILPKSSTNSERRKKGKRPHAGLRRRRRIEDTRRWRADDGHDMYTGDCRSILDPLEDGECLERAGYVQQAPSIADGIAKLAETPLEQDVIGLTRSGQTQQQVAASLGVSRARVRRIVAKILGRWELQAA
jgi:Sigma-70, region 4